VELMTQTPTTGPTEDGPASSRASFREWLGDWGGKLTITLGVLAVGYLVWQRTGWGGQSHRTIISDASFLPLSLAGAILAWRTARAARGDSRTRQAWVIVGAAFFCYWVGDTLWFYLENFRTAPPFPSVADVFYLAFYPLLLIGLLRFPVGVRGKIDRAKFWLDSVTVLLSALMIVWFFVLGPIARTHDSFFSKAISLAYPVGDLVLVFGIAAIMLRGPAESCRRALAILAMGLGLFVVADVGFAYYNLHSGYAGGDWPDSLWMVAQFLMVVAAQHHYMGLKQEAAVEGPHRPAQGSRVSKIPYAAIGIAFGLMLYAGHREALYPLGGLIGISVLITALVLGRQVTVMRDNSHLMNALQTMATTDPLTGLRNRSDFYDAADLEFERLKRFGLPFVAMMFDVDHFKEVNDRYGHAGGDAVLSAVGATFVRRLRGFDLIGRNGGDEFVALLPQIEIESALVVAERVGVAVRGMPVLHADEVIPVSLSIGIASAEGVDSLPELLHRADLALYAAKQAGRNCARSYTGDAPVTAL
jgi:diguanylate cyclase